MLGVSAPRVNLYAFGLSDRDGETVKAGTRTRDFERSL